MVVAGTRPEFIKLAPVIETLTRIPSVDLIFIHSGQHYDAGMSEGFIKELGLPEPVQNFAVGGKSDPRQIATTIVQSETAFRRYEPDLVLAQGDTNTVVAVALAAAKAKVPFGHVEAGLRSFDRAMPEEINRVVADSCSDLCFSPTETSAVNLCREGILPDRIHITGNTIVDACQKYVSKALARSNIFNEINLKGRYGLVTLHRKENVDNVERLSRIVEALCEVDQVDLVFPIHPRTQRQLSQSRLWRRIVRSPHLILSRPLGYIDFLRLLVSSAVVLTDSGGVQEEALTLRVPCITLRDNTERPETVIAGGNRLVGTRKDLVVSALEDILPDPRRAVARIACANPLGDGRAGPRIAKLCVDYCEGIVSSSNDSFSDPELGEFISVVVRAKDRGVTLREFCNRVQQSRVTVSMVYDALGKPVFPREDLRLDEGWLLCLFGHRSHLEPARAIGRDIGPILDRTVRLPE